MNAQVIATDSRSEELLKLQSLPLELKVMLTKNRIEEWYEHFKGMVYVSFSGGKDSTVLLDLVRSLYPEVPGVFSNTGLEYPEVVKFVKTIDNVVMKRPKKNFRKVIEEDGYPIVSKMDARKISTIKSANPATNAATINLYKTGYSRAGTYNKHSKLAAKWMYLTQPQVPFDATNKCCDYLKKHPFVEYEKETGRVPFIGVTHDEGGARRKMGKSTCNFFAAPGSNQKSKSQPMWFWTEDDVWQYIRENNLPYASIYDKGERRTGCMFCAYGVHLEKGQNRFQRMAETHPKLYKYCIVDLGFGPVLGYMGIRYKPEIKQEQLEMFHDAAEKAV